MGEAENVVLRELAQKKAAEERKKAQDIRNFVQELREVVPQVIAYFRSRNYSVEYGRDVLEINGEQRIGWKIGTHYDDYIYLLGDGTFSLAAYLSPGCAPMDAQALGAICDYVGNQRNIIKNLRGYLP